MKHEKEFLQEESSEIAQTLVQKVPKAKSKKSKTTYLSLVEAQQRSSIISNVNYDVSLMLPKGNSYYGEVSIEFDLTKDGVSKGLFLDFEG